MPVLSVSGTEVDNPDISFRASGHRLLWLPWHAALARQHNEEMYKKVMISVYKQGDATSR